MNPLQARNLVTKIAPDEPARALQVARKIGDPSMRAQALSSVGRYWPDPKKYAPIIDEAVKAIDLLPDETRAMLGAWPVRAYLERDNPVAARRLIARYLRVSDAIDDRAARSSALLMLLQAARPFAYDVWEPVFRALVRAAEPPLSWRQGDALDHATQMIAGDHPELIEDARRKLSDERNLAAIERGLRRAASRPGMPRPFF